ncbi:hypothetical protein [Actinomadura rudentiformis]|uniref:Uncharacterized protein n=1 Tax=Actinomadura rudentiformis TaxID=359158 RepID=A0A6H9YFS5_9ACTN|nr:hypothetical protein [Actinomadura rudentiformis]KAB2344900.1 hypothetical protein F8566_30385 [Actinomadura rudentiformis]
MSESSDRETWHEVFQQAKALHLYSEQFETVTLGLANPGEIPDAPEPAAARPMAHRLHEEIVRHFQQLEQLMAAIPH